MNPNGHQTVRVRNVPHLAIRNFIITSTVDGEVIASGKGANKHDAHDAAAERALVILMAEDP